ncbi:DUF418 domain-containing protein [Hyphomonas sp.]|uniref:DUF418 domain-containing protein n=1 Tax=Hyphomonas sp. TaxID=87 RepID=UPI0025C4A9B3|nr:DUF418 domain-containing protein [Hyphomonas sp.]
MSDRALMPDLLRAFALFGIAVVNVTAFAQPFSSGFHNGGLNTAADQVVYGAVGLLFFMKSYPLFSMMFGAGLSFQLMAAERAGKDFAPRYFRRMAALIVLGVLHFVFFWFGDILLTYGLLGCLLFVLRNASVKTLVRTGIILILINTLLLLAIAVMVWAGETYAPEAMAEAGYEEMDAAARVAFAEGTFWQAALYRLKLLPLVLPSVIVQQGISVFGFFCFGLAAVKAGTIDQPMASIWKLSRRVFLPIGLAGSALGSWILLQAGSAVDSTFVFGSAVIMGFSAFSALGYAGLIAAISSGAGGPVSRFLAKAGSASLTAYLLQSLLFSLIFTAYGLDQFGRMGAAEAIGVAAAVALASLLFTGIWRSFAPRGPMEVLLRRITYWGRS